MDLHLEWIRKDIGFLRREISKICNAELDIDVLICDVQNFKDEIIQKSPDLKLKKLMNESPFVKALIENLGARPID